MRGFRTADSREVYRGRVTVRLDEVRTPDGETLTREIVEAIDSVVVVALVGDDVLLVRQHRQPTGGELLELPAGVCDVPGETPVQVAARELAEETRHGGGTLVTLGTFWASPGWTTQRFTVVLARDVEPVDEPDGFDATGEERHMQVVRRPLAEVVEALGRPGGVVDGAGGLALLLARRALS